MCSPATAVVAVETRFSQGVAVGDSSVADVGVVWFPLLGEGGGGRISKSGESGGKRGRGDDNVDVDDRFSGEAGHGGATDVFDGEEWDRVGAEKEFEGGLDLGECGGPGGVVGLDVDAHLCDEDGGGWCGVGAVD